MKTRVYAERMATGRWLVTMCRGLHVTMKVGSTKQGAVDEAARDIEAAELRGIVLGGRQPPLVERLSGEAERIEVARYAAIREKERARAEEAFAERVLQNVEPEMREAVAYALELASASPGDGG